MAEPVTEEELAELEEALPLTGAGIVLRSVVRELRSARRRVAELKAELELQRRHALNVAGATEDAWLRTMRESVERSERSTQALVDSDRRLRRAMWAFTVMLGMFVLALVLRGGHL